MLSDHIIMEKKDRNKGRLDREGAERFFLNDRSAVAFWGKVKE